MAELNDISNAHIIYFLARYTEGFKWIEIKIGRTKVSNYQKRMDEHFRDAKQGKYNLKFICAVKSSSTAENHLKREFSYIKTDSEELFQPTEELIDYIRWLRDQFDVWTPDGLVSSPVEMPFCKYANWSPSEERRKPHNKNGFGIEKYSWYEKQENPRDFEHLIYLNLPPRRFSKDSYYTNPKIIERVKELYNGQIDLDPSTHAEANSYIKAKTFYTEDDDGLKQQWFGKVWLNPPFSQWSLWSEKVNQELQSGRVEQLCLLVATRTLSAQYFASLLEKANAQCITYGRIPFRGMGKDTTPDDGHMILYFGKNVKKFVKLMSPIGTSAKLVHLND